MNLCCSPCPLSSLSIIPASILALKGRFWWWIDVYHIWIVKFVQAWLPLYFRCEIWGLFQDSLSTCWPFLRTSVGLVFFHQEIHFSLNNSQLFQDFCPLFNIQRFFQVPENSFFKLQDLSRIQGRMSTMYMVYRLFKPQSLPYQCPAGLHVWWPTAHSASPCCQTCQSFRLACHPASQSGSVKGRNVGEDGEGGYYYFRFIECLYHNLYNFYILILSSIDIFPIRLIYLDYHP